jgi:hypothetical protein
LKRDCGWGALISVDHGADHSNSRIVAAVDEADQTVKLEQLVNTQDGFIRIEVPILD